MPDNDLSDLITEIQAAHSQMLVVEETVKQAARGITGILVTGFMVTITLLLSLVFACLLWVGALASIFPKPHSWDYQAASYPPPYGAVWGARGVDN